MRKGFFKLFLFVLLFFAIVPEVSLAEGKIPIPKQVGDLYVQDFANLLSPEEKRELLTLGRQLDDATGAQIVVLTVDTTNGVPIEDYAFEAFRTYKPGNAKLDNGVLFVLAMNDKKMRVEVGQGLEGALPDGKVGRMLDDFVVPYLQNNQPNLATLSVYKSIYNEVAREYQLDPSTYTPLERPNNAGQNQAQPTEESSPFMNFLFAVIVIGLIIIDFIFFGGFFTFTILHLFGRGGGGGGGPRGGGGGSSSGGGASRGW